MPFRRLRSGILLQCSSLIRQPHYRRYNIQSVSSSGQSKHLLDSRNPSSHHNTNTNTKTTVNKTRGIKKKNLEAVEIMPRDLPTDIAHPNIQLNLKHHSIPLSEWKQQASSQGYQALAVGAFLFRTIPIASTTETKEGDQTRTRKPLLLLLLRAATDSFPNVWEPPGGSVDAEDATLLHGLVREVYEETGLRVSSVLRQVWDGDSAQGTRCGGDQRADVSFLGKQGERWCKLNFVVDCLPEGGHGENGEGEGEAGESGQRVRKGGDFNVQLDKDEHQDWGWFSREEMEQVPFISEQGRRIARDAFDAFDDLLVERV